MPKMNEKADSRMSDDYTPVKDQKRSFQTEIHKIKSMGWKEGWSYFWIYYRIPVIVIIASILIVISLISSIIENNKPVLISGIIINNSMNAEGGEDLFEKNFCEYLGEDPDKVNTTLQTGLTFDPEDAGGMSQTIYYKLTAEVAAGDIDFFGGDTAVFSQFNDKYEDGHYCQDLTNVLPEDLYNAFQDKFYYMTDENGKEIPVGIDITGSPFYRDMQFQGKECYVGFIVNSKNNNNFISFLRYIFEL